MLGKFPTHQHFGLCCIHCFFCSFQNSNLPNALDGGAFSRDIFSFKFVDYQSLQRCQIFVRKQAIIWKITNIDTIFISWKDINPWMPWLMLWLLQKFVTCENQTCPCCKWSCLFVRCFLFPICILPTAWTLPSFMLK